MQSRGDFTPRQGLDVCLSAAESRDSANEMVSPERRQGVRRSGRGRVGRSASPRCRADA